MNLQIDMIRRAVWCEDCVCSRELTPSREINSSIDSRKKFFGSDFIRRVLHAVLRSVDDGYELASDNHLFDNWVEFHKEDFRDISLSFFPHGSMPLALRGKLFVWFKSQILYRLNKTFDSKKSNGCVYKLDVYCSRECQVARCPKYKTLCKQAKEFLQCGMEFDQKTWLWSRRILRGAMIFAAGFISNRFSAMS